MASTADEPETIASAAEPSVPFPVVGIGASAGGLEAISALLAAVRFDSMAFVVIQHLAPKHESMLPEILGRATTMPVVAITDGMKIEKNRVHVAPAGVDVTIQRGVFETSADAPGSAPHHSIDVFLRALALDQRQSAIGIVLSGTGTDGTLGLRAIKAEGGVVFVQDPASAKYPGMPQSALDAGGMDFKGSPEAIARELTTISTHPYLALRAAPLVPSPDLLERIFTLLRATFGNDLTHYKQGTLLRRIERRMALLGCNTLENYVKVLETAPLEPTLLYRDMLINVTSFFRDKEPFDVLKTVVFPRMLAAKRPGDPIRIWSAGCSTGEEPYSLAMTLLEHLGSRAQEYKLQVFGTDVDDDAVQKARRGVYPETISLDVSEERLLRWFTRVNGSYQVTQGVRDKVIFATQNVLQDAPFSRLDLIACRNVMIYLQPRLQKKVLRIFNYALQPEGCLLLGSSETVGDAVDLFGSLDKKNKIYFKKNVGAAPQILDVAAGSFTRGQGDPRPARPVGRVPATLEQLADRAIIESYGPPGVVLDLNLNVVQFRGWTGDYLESPPGTATFNILKLARPELMFVLRPAIQQSVRDDAPVTVPAVSFRTGDGERTIALKVVPIHVHGDGRVGSLVLFEEPTRDEASPARVAQGTAPNAGESDLAESNRRLEQELGATKNYLQVTVEDLEAANEELQSANEELQSANEELQSTNEELETSKEELQSTNEELGTVNDELQTRMRDLGEVNDDLQNLLRGTDVALVIVGLDLRIRRYTHQAEALFGLGEQDLGRSITHLKTLVSSPTLESVVRDVIEHVSPRAEEVRASNDHWYEMRVIPYQTQDRSIRGAVITFEDIDVIKWRVELSHEAHSLALNRVASSSEAILILNRHRRVLWANGVLYEKFGLTKSDVVGHIFPDLAAEKFGAAAVTTAIERVVNEGAMVSSIPLPQDGAGPYMLTASRFPGEVSLGPRIEVAIRGGGDPK